ncbi:RDD family protein [Limibacter armeniacum]|uniref:RDD family protein n=1 Tax=Limibacter armeniacum TaxID=466084 RepID=UPI002FE59AAE
MKHVSFQNSQNVTLSYTPATVTRRIGAYLIDNLILGALFIVLLLIVNSTQSEEALKTLIYLAIFFYLLYPVLFEIFNKGRSLGKVALKIKVIAIDGSQPSIGQFLMRWLFRLIDIPLYGIVAILSIIIGGKGQRVGDIVAKTTVISDEEKNRSVQFRPIKFDEHHTVTYPQAISLTDKQVKIIEKTLALPINSNSYELAMLLSNKLQEKLVIDTYKKGNPFLKILLDDYYYLTIHQHSNLSE